MLSSITCARVQSSGSWQSFVSSYSSAHWTGTTSSTCWGKCLEECRGWGFVGHRGHTLWEGKLLLSEVIHVTINAVARDPSIDGTVVEKMKGAVGSSCPCGIDGATATQMVFEKSTNVIWARLYRWRRPRGARGRPPRCMFKCVNALRLPLCLIFVNV